MDRVRFRLVFGLALSALVLAVGSMAARSFWSEYASFATPGTPPNAEQRERARRELPGLSEVSWQSRGNTLRGWFVPGRERAAVVLVHGSGGNRADVLPELRILSSAGFSVLAFDWPGQGESTGFPEWDEAERSALHAGVDWLAARPEVDPDRIGAYGFSLGGYLLIQEAIGDPRLRAIVAAGTPATMVDHTLNEHRMYGHGALSAYAALLAMRARGMHPWAQVAADIIPELAPRPLLVVLGEADTTVPPAMSRALFAAAREPKQLLAIPGAGHGAYAQVGQAVYEERLSAFFTSALAARAGAANHP